MTDTPTNSLALARKWRPKQFSELVGQTHVSQALSNALEQQRLHHAYLFTGTRGVGKTTIERIFSKALNCEQGMSAHPCGQCSVCQSIDQGRFVDLIEVDAASKTKVEDTRELLDNVQYAPVQGRYKVYLIDEVHMLSKSSFNALLKTLEEPPEHVKFLLATTDPHKLPPTVLSRCLQFNLMRLTLTQLQSHLAQILSQEGIDYEAPALALLAKSADGSARDGLSLLDQAIAMGAGTVQTDAVKAMLGLVDQSFCEQILQALHSQDAQAIKTLMQHLAQTGVDYEALLAQLIEALHQVSLWQVLQLESESPVITQASLESIAAALSMEQIQAWYQIALLGQKDLSLAPDIRIGFEMTLLRLLAFEPYAPEPTASATASPPDSPAHTSAPAAPQASTQASTQAAHHAPTQTPTTPPEATHPPVADSDTLMSMMSTQDSSSAPSPTPQPSAPNPPTAQNTANTLNTPPDTNTATEPQAFSNAQPARSQPASTQTPQAAQTPSQPLVQAQTATTDTPQSTATASLTPWPLADWEALIARLSLTGLPAELARHCICLAYDAHRLVLSLDPDQPEARSEMAWEQLEAQVKALLGVRLVFEIYTGAHKTPAKAQAQAQQAQIDAAQQSIEQDPTVQSLRQHLNLELLTHTLKPLGSTE